MITCALRASIRRAKHSRVRAVGEHLAELVVVDHVAARGRVAQRLIRVGELEVFELRFG